MKKLRHTAVALAKFQHGKPRIPTLLDSCAQSPYPEKLLPSTVDTYGGIKLEK
jgi:hypothetical protein